ncbi:MAG: hypothetical protein LRY55_01045 [Leadbetterella sp.]|nr:hypothetical protein [Leadbetterella sp.]
MSKTPTIPVPKAIQLTTNWRSFYAEIYNDSVEHTKKIDPDGKEVFRGFRIPLEDLEQLLKIAKKFNTENSEEKINSIRAYLVKDSEDPKLLGDIHVILVPVVGGNEMEPFPSKSATPYGTDLLQMEDRALGTTESVIYDFTSPCPTECDTDSDLYSPQP